MFIMPAPKIDMPLPVWERGYRCHGYWLGNTRVGHVGLTPRGFPVVYSWSLDNPTAAASGECATLRATKRRVEAAFRKHYSWRFPASRGSWR